MTPASTKTTKATRRVASLPVRASYDSAQTTNNNKRLWALADLLSANVSNSPEVRSIIRSRARYEIANNSWAKGMVLTLAKSTIGKGPRLQLNTPDREMNRLAEVMWVKWSRRIRLAAKLRTMRMARVSDGETFGLIGINPNLDIATNVDLRLIEADQVASPARMLNSYLADNEIVDGIEFDAYGNPTAYYLLPHHPGGSSLDVGMEARRIDARQVIHWQREDRAGAHRAVPEIAPALPLFSQLRRYTLAVVDAAETAADYSVVFSTDLLGSDSFGNQSAATDVKESSTFGAIELERRMATFLPEGWKASQIKAEQPTTIYDAFVRSIINEIARCLEIPLNIASGNSGGYNFASGRLDGRIFDKFIDVETDDCESVVVERLYDIWVRQLTLMSAFSAWRNYEDDIPHQYFWDGAEAIDPAKEAAAQKIKLESGTTTRAREYARLGRDWETEQEQGVRERLNEIRLAKELASDFGLSEDDAVAIVTAQKAGDINFVEKEEE